MGLTAFLVATIGCGGLSTGRTTGQITLQGKPVGGADLRFTSTTNAEDIFFGVSDSRGNYQVSYRTLDGLPAGKYLVEVTAYTLPDGTPFPPGERAEALKSEGKLVGATYEFEQEIAVGENTIHFELNQGRKASNKK